MDINVTIASKSSRIPRWLAVHCEAGSSPSCDARRVDAVTVRGSRNVFIRYEEMDDAWINEDNEVARVRVIKGDVGDRKDVIVHLGMINELLTLDITALKKTIEVVLLQKNQLQRVINQGSGNLIVKDNILSTMGSSLSIATVGSGDTYASSTETIRVDTVTLSSRGSGRLQMVFSEVRVSKFRAEYYASGDMTLFIDSESDVYEFAVIAEGSGDACLGWDSPITVNQFQVSHIGSGDVSVGPRGLCQSAKLAMQSSGKLDVGGVQCDMVDVDLMSSGKVTVQAMNYLDVEAYGSGRVEFTGAAPHAIASRGNRQLFPTLVSNPYVPVNCKRHKVPVIKAKYAAVSTGVLASAELDSAESSSSVAAHSDAVGIYWNIKNRDKDNILPLLAVVFVVALILRWFNNSRRRAREEERPPLLGAQRRVYV
ncbi:hypothetical protein P3T76_009094 [Phytophthora citrophthora]|uniref:Putative auto-transporter adhesin head GIN domain-containing protein n=1 Tax=Phytophthora citrophthora TaxID=4793 RepID=A0AAD9GIE5_9STRA|nr:hypothetical protein P3T76_009094 [Phytophthora citrophthora]